MFSIAKSNPATTGQPTLATVLDSIHRVDNRIAYISPLFQGQGELRVSEQIAHLKVTAVSQGEEIDADVERWIRGLQLQTSELSELADHAEEQQENLLWAKAKTPPPRALPQPRDGGRIAKSLSGTWKDTDDPFT
jgi:hypothetical protein